MILSLACDTILILSQEALFCYPHHFRLLYSPQHSWGIRLFIYNWVKRLRQKGCVDLPASTGHTYRAPESQEVVRVEFYDTDPIPYEQPLNVSPAATERNNFSVAESMKLSVGSFHLTIPNGTDPQFLAQTLRIVKELEC